MIPEIDASQFDAEISGSDRPVLVDFFTPLCGPCRLMLPIIYEIAQERAATLKVVKFDAAKDPAFASRFRISSVPNFVLLQRGAPIGQRSGSTPKREMLSWIDTTLS